MAPYIQEPCISDESLADSSTRVRELLRIISDIAMDETQRIAQCRVAVGHLYVVLRDSPGAWRSYIPVARSIITQLDLTTYMQDADNTTEQVYMINAIQRLAFGDADNGAITDLDSWTARHLLTILQREPNNIVALRAAGWAWLQRAQPALSRIHRLDGSSSSSAGSAGSQALVASVANGDEDRVMAQANAEAERRAGTADYVEARGFLQPATEYLTRAVTVALTHQIRSGELLSTTAEAYMSLGNASSPRVNEPLFRRAVQLLRVASNVADYTLPGHLQQYLDDFGRLVD